MNFHSFCRVELRSLDDLRLPDVDILKGLDGADVLLELTSCPSSRMTMPRLLSDLPHMRGMSIRGLLHLYGPALGESDNEKAEVAICRLHINVSLNQFLPFANERPKFVGGEVHAVEVREANLALHFVNPEADLPDQLLLVLVLVSRRDVNDTTPERVVGIFYIASNV